ncbi:hypothetical protein ACTHSU_11040, partial [Neisseria sp. P0009.S005]|uniref:hypothetical protein n=1 Tax=Neisseria sp. P0009.S005 TaxID=3436712 RepID=UPI003F7E8D2F
IQYIKKIKKKIIKNTKKMCYTFYLEYKTSSSEKKPTIRQTIKNNNKAITCFPKTASMTPLATSLN